MDADELNGLAEGVLSTLDGASPLLARTFAAGLALAGQPVSLFADTVDCYADVLEFDDVSGDLARLSMCRALRRAAREGSLIATLSTAREPFWRAAGDALALLAADLRPAW